MGLGTEVKTTGPGKRLGKQWELSLGGCPRAAGKECGMWAKENGLSFSRNENHHAFFFSFFKQNDNMINGRDSILHRSSSLMKQCPFPLDSRICL